uniref:Uncharacterized protein n=1 Tax=Anguilla anguilla TaxID=7936 RepID=A0A0E9WZM0_ANGAN
MPRTQVNQPHKVDVFGSPTKKKTFPGFFLFPIFLLFSVSCECIFSLREGSRLFLWLLLFVTLLVCLALKVVTIGRNGDFVYLNRYVMLVYLIV